MKANQKPLLDCAIAAFAAADATGHVPTYKCAKTGQGRSERRRASVIATTKAAVATPGLTAFGRITNERTRHDGTTSWATHYIALSRRLPPKRLLTVTRSQWSVENHLHRQLDVVFNEDDARARKNHAPGNMSVIRRMALDILKAHPDKRPQARKMNLLDGTKLSV